MFVVEDSLHSRKSCNLPVPCGTRRRRTLSRTRILSLLTSSAHQQDRSFIFVPFIVSFFMSFFICTHSVASLKFLDPVPFTSKQCARTGLSVLPQDNSMHFPPTLIPKKFFSDEVFSPPLCVQIVIFSAEQPVIKIMGFILRGINEKRKTRIIPERFQRKSSWSELFKNDGKIIA